MEQDYLSLCDIQFDAAFDQIEGLARYPWVGSKFANSDCRPLIIGASHYATDGKDFSKEALEELKDKDSTRGVINTVISNKCEGKATWPMYEGLLKTFIEIFPEKVKDFWSKVAFYNFIQRVMKSPSEKSKKEDRIIGWKCLAGIATVLRPTSIIIVGISNWESIEVLDQIKDIKWRNWIWDDDYKISRTSPAVAKIIMPNQEIPITLIHHTSQEYSHNLWREYLEKRDPQLMAYLSK